MIHGEDWYMIRDLLREGVSISAIARQTGHDRKTIQKIRDAPAHPPPQQRRRRGSKLDPYLPYLRQRAERGVLNAVKLTDELKRQGYAGSVRLVCLALHPLRPSTVCVVERFETPPGQQAQVDWASCGRLWYRGRLRTLFAFVLTLGYSRRQYVEFTVSQKLGTFLQCHVHAFRSFGGVPKEVLYDNLKTAVDHRDQDGAVVWNRQFRDFADFYGLAPRACQPYRAQTKGKVESGVKYLKGNFLLGLDVVALTLEELNGQGLRWVRETADLRIHGTTHERPVDRWPAETAALQPLAGHPDYDTSTISPRLVSREGFISYEGARYAVPPQHAGHLVLVKESDAGRLRIFADDRCVVEHAIAEMPGMVVASPEHAAAVRALARGPSRSRGQPVGEEPQPWQLRCGVFPSVELRPLTVYDEAVALATGGTLWKP